MKVKNNSVLFSEVFKTARDANEQIINGETIKFEDEALQIQKLIIRSVENSEEGSKGLTNLQNMIVQD